MSSIGDVEFDIMRGLIANLKTRLETWEVPGLDGYGAQTLGLGDARCGLTTVVYCASNAAADAVILACEAMQATLQTVIDDFADEFDGMLIEKVDTTGAKTPCVHEGNFNAVRVQISWQLCSTQVQA